MILVLGLGVKATSGVALSMADSLQTAIGTAVPGVVLIFVGSFAPLALFKLLAFVDPGTSSGSAMRAGLAAQGGWQGLLNGRADGASGSDAASSSDPSGQSAGEGATEAATNDRFTRSAGGLLGALGGGGQMLAQGWGMAQGLGSQAAAVGADLTNQMGVGHNTYIPDFSGSRSRPGQRGRSRDDDTPRGPTALAAQWLGMLVRLAAERLGEAGSAALAAGCASPEVVARYRAKVVQVTGSDCRWWTGAVSGRGHGRFWLAPGWVVVSHRFALALVHGVSAPAGAEMLGVAQRRVLRSRIGARDEVAAGDRVALVVAGPGGHAQRD
jgi:hypothetical protein